MEQISLAVIEDVTDIRNSLYDYFRQQEEFKTVTAVESMEDFFKSLQEKDLPDVILCDIGLPGMNGIEGIKKIKDKYAQVDIIMLTVFNNSDKIFKSICAGATGYALKDTPLPELKKAVLEIREGGSYMSPSIARKVIEHFAPVRKKEPELLTTKEKQIIQGLTEGLSYKLIADKLSVSVDTVRFHIKNIYRKLHVNSKAEVISKALKGHL
ncbi:response regulator [Chitinophagaceae bacterium MMS25-I14]